MYAIIKNYTIYYTSYKHTQAIYQKLEPNILWLDKNSE